MNTGADGFVLTNTVLFREDSHYYSEPIFVPDPNGVREDSGALVSLVYDGVRRESYILILDATTMEVMAKSYLGLRYPIDFHGTFILA